MLSALFDPFGFVTPLMLLAKIIIPTLCRTGIGWGKCIAEANREARLKWVSGLPLLSRLKIPRCIMPFTKPSNCSICLNHFSDASTNGYGTVSYLRAVTEDKKVQCRFMFAKIATHADQSVSIPRLELMAVCLAVQVDILIRWGLIFNVGTLCFGRIQRHFSK